MKPISEENIIFESQDKTLRLTNLRIIKTQKNGAREEISYMFLEHLSSSHLRSIDPKFLIYIGSTLALLGIFGSILGESSGGILPSVVVGVIFAGLYFLFRRQVIEFTGFGGEKISYPTNSNPKESKELFEKVALAKMDYKNSPLRQVS